VSRLAHLALYTEASTENPLGVRPLRFWLQNPAAAPKAAPMMSGYYPSEFYVPTPCNITMRPQANVLGYFGQDAPPPPSITQYLSDPQTMQYLLLGGAALALFFAFKQAKPRGRRRR
jgi:hypothetical protein